MTLIDIDKKYRCRNDFAKLITDMALKQCVEVGVCYGNNASFLLDNSNLEVLYGVENWHTKFARRFQENTKNKMAQYGERFVWKIGNSVDVAAEFVDDSLDFVYIDADHRYPYILADMRSWWPKVRVGGFFGGHDYVENRRKCDVVQAVDEFFNEMKRKFFVTDPTLEDGALSSWWVIK